jgi:hypothetical protein
MFCEDCSILQPTDPFPLTGKLALSLWPVTSAPVRTSLRSLSFDQLTDLPQLCILALFSFVNDCPQDPSSRFPVDDFKAAFLPESFLHPVSLPQNQGFLFILIGRDSTHLSCARCISLQQVLRARPIGPGPVRCFREVSDLFPPFSQMSLRYPVNQVPHLRPSFVPMRSSLAILKADDPGSKNLLWQKADKLEKWREHLTEIVPGVFVGSSSVALDEDLLSRAGITHTVNCVSQLVDSLPSLTNWTFPMNDGGDENILSHVWSVVCFIETALVAGRKVLVHCIEGVSRSVAVVIAYLIVTQNVDYASAYRMVRTKRRVASPHPKFIAQLCQLCEVIGATQAKTCAFSRQKKIVFNVVARRGVPVAVPLYNEPDATEDSVLIVVDYQNARSLYRGSEGPGGTIELKVGQTAPPELRQHALKVVDELGKCIKTGTAASSRRKAYRSDDWNEVEEFDEASIEADAIVVVFDGGNVTVVVGKGIGGETDLDEKLAQCCKVNGLPVPEDYDIRRPGEDDEP